jgi:hypothetical protein
MYYITVSMQCYTRNSLHNRYNLHQAAKAAEKGLIGFEIVEKQTLKKYKKSLCLFEDLLIFW